MAFLDPSKKRKVTVIECPRCELVHQFENKYCSKCSYPLKPEPYKEVKQKEINNNKKIELLKNQLRS